MEQTFGIDVKKYIGHRRVELPYNRQKLSKEQLTDAERLVNLTSEGHYLFLPDWNETQPQSYSQINDDIIYQKGNNIEQWTIFFTGNSTDEKAIIKIRYAPTFWGKNTIEFEVELGPIPITDDRSKDVSINW